MRMRNARVSFAILSLVLCTAFVLTGCNGMLKSIFESPQSDYQPELAHSTHSATVSGDEERRTGSDVNQTYVAPAPAPQSKQDKQTKAVEDAGSFFSSLATLLPPPWNLLVPGLVTGGVSWWAAKRRYKTKQA
jgi:hypothetical protein